MCIFIYSTFCIQYIILLLVLLYSFGHGEINKQTKPANVANASGAISFLSIVWSNKVAETKESVYKGGGVDLS